MTSIPRLLAASNNPATRRLLEAGLRDRAPERSVLALSAALGLEAAASAAPVHGALGASASAPATSAATAPSAALPIGKALPSALSIGKCLVMGMVAGSVSSAGYWAIQKPATREPAARWAAVSAQKKHAVPRAPRTALPQRSPSEPAVPEPRSVTETVPLPRARLASAARTAFPAEAAPPAPQPAEGAALPPVRVDGALERETRLVDEARQALAARDASRAAAVLDQYDATRALGVLDREALLLRIELSLMRGDQQRALSLSERFAQRYPSDAHLVRLRALLSAAGASKRSPK